MVTLGCFFPGVWRGSSRCDTGKKAVHFSNHGQPKVLGPPGPGGDILRLPQAWDEGVCGGAPALQHKWPQGHQGSKHF